MPATPFELGPDVHPYAHVTRSPIAQELLRLAAEAPTKTLRIPWTGTTADQAHIRVRAFRRTMGRHGHRLFYKREPGALLLWAKPDPTINPSDFITAPRSSRRRHTET